MNDDVLVSPQELARRARAIKLSRREWCRHAGIAESTLRRWIGGHNAPLISNYQKLIRILIEMEKSYG